MKTWMIISSNVVHPLYVKICEIMQRECLRVYKKKKKKLSRGWDTDSQALFVSAIRDGELIRFIHSFINLSG